MAKEDFHRKLLFLCTSHTLLHVYTNLPIALLPILISEYGLSIFLASLIVSIPRVVSLVFSVPSGLLADRCDHTRLISLSLFLNIVAAFLIFLFRNIETTILGFSLTALASTFYHPSALSATSNVSPQIYLSRALGFHGASGTFGISLGPITLGLVLNWFEWRYVYLIWVAPILFIAVTAFFMILDKHLDEGLYNERIKRNPISSLRDILSATFLSFILLMLCISAGGGTISTYLTTFLTESKGLDTSLAAIIFGLSPLIGLTSVITGGYAGDKLGWRRSLTLIISTTTVALFFMFVSTSIIQTVLFYLLYGFFNIMTMPITTSLVAKIVPEKSRGTAYSLQFIPESVIGIVVPITLGILIGLLEISVIFPVAMAFFIIALIVTRTIRIQ